MDNDNFSPLKIRGSQILGLKKLAVNAIEAEGILLGEKTFAESANSISWKDALGNIRERISGQTSSNIHQIVLEALGLGEGLKESATLNVRASDGTGLNPAFITAVVGGGEPKRIIETGGKSHFLQLFGGARKKQIELYTATLTYPGGSQTSNTLTVNHGLGVKPTQLLTGAGTSLTHLLAGEIVSNTQIKLQTFCFAGAPPVGATVEVTFALVA